MGLVSLRDVETEPVLPTSGARTALLESVAAERRTARRHRHLRSIAGGLAIAAGAAGLGFVVADRSATEPPAEADLTLYAHDQASGVDAEVQMSAVGWGTEIALELSGVEAGQTCSLVARSAEGSEIAGTWRVPSDVEHYMEIPGAVGAPMADIEAFDVVAADGETLIHIPSQEVAAAPAE